MARIPVSPSEIQTHRLTTPILIALASWNLLMLIMSIIVVARPGNGPSSYTFEGLFIDDVTRLGMVGLWCVVPFLTASIAALDVLRRTTNTARRMLFSASFGASTYALMAVLWASCAYQGGLPICYAGGWSYFVEHRDPQILKFFLPGFAAATSLVYAIIAVFAIVAFRRHRRAASDDFYQQSLAAQKRMSIESSEIGTSTIGDMTLPSRPRSMAPSRQLSTTRPPTYYSSAGDSLLTVDEKSEKGENRGSVGYF